MRVITTPAQAAAIRQTIRSVRNRAGLSQRAFADQIGTQSTIVNRWESGARNPSLASLQRIMQLAALTPDERRAVCAVVLGLDPVTWEPVAGPAE